MTGVKKMFLVTEFIALLGTNLILMQALGTSTLFIACNSKKNLVFTASVITFFTTFGSAVSYFIDRFAGNGKLSDFRLLFYILATGFLYVFLLSVFYFVSRNLFEKIRKYIHISVFNCAVMGTLFTVSEKYSGYSVSLSEYVLGGFQAGAGFIIASLILTSAYRSLNSAKVPVSFRGFPAMLIYLGIISMAVYALK